MGNRLDITVRDYTIRYHKLYEEVGTLTDVVISDDYDRIDLSLEDEFNYEDPLALLDWICERTKYNSELTELLEFHYNLSQEAYVHGKCIDFEDWKEIYEKHISD